MLLVGIAKALKDSGSNNPPTTIAPPLSTSRRENAPIGVTLDLLCVLPHQPLPGAALKIEKAENKLNLAREKIKANPFRVI
ncbi:hypothetical protein [Entomohabitans teleogrylli]|uniref:hypothetical protein n=1 Tax=Entomohabitans teleogrylli TaxID=1384589 RepID=UPI00137ADF47|nr:hypothetical protein [Entomohabitans teleogrylli]